MRDRLLDSLYRALDKDPQPVIALRFGHPHGFAWTVSGRVLTAGTEAGEEIARFDLKSMTIGELAGQMVAAGFDLRYQNHDTNSLLADSLLDGSGRESASNGDHLSCFTSTLWSIVDAYAVELETARVQVSEAVDQVYMTEADGEFLDLWGSYYGIPREEDEPDPAYCARIIYEILRPKSNPVAMSEAASAIAGVHVDIYEPWRDLFWLSESKLDQEIMFDGQYWSPYIFRPVLRSKDNIQWARIRRVLERIRPAGVMMYEPEWLPDVRDISVPDSALGVCQTEYRSLRARYDDRLLLDAMHFGDQPTLNYQIISYALHGLTNDTRLSDPYSLATRRDFVRAQVVLSDTPVLGDGQCRLPRYTEANYGVQTLGDIVLSDAPMDFVERLPVEVVEFPLFMLGTGLSRESIKTSSFSSNGLRVVVTAIFETVERPMTFSSTRMVGASFGVASDAVPYRWTGVWDSRVWSGNAFFSYSTETR